MSFFIVSMCSIFLISFNWYVSLPLLVVNFSKNVEKGAKLNAMLQDYNCLLISSTSRK